MNNLVIGNTSQLSYYFPEEYEKISSRNIDFKSFKDKYYDSIYITFAEQRLNEIKHFTDYIEINTYYTNSVLEFFKNRANRIVIYGSCELWNNYQGDIGIEDPFNFSIESAYAGYCVSKKMLIEFSKEMYDNVIVIHPFNFNSPYRKSQFLFSKIFDSIINKKKIEIGDTYFYRDLVHPKYVVERSILAEKDEIVGSGRLIFMNDFIRELYIKNGLEYEDFVTEKYDLASIPKKKILYLRSKEIKYTNLLKDTLDDITRFQNNIS